jgi:hypothetical protein
MRASGRHNLLAEASRQRESEATCNCKAAFVVRGTMHFDADDTRVSERDVAQRCRDLRGEAFLGTVSPNPASSIRTEDAERPVLACQELGAHLGKPRLQGAERGRLVHCPVHPLLELGKAAIDCMLQSFRITRMPTTQ